MRLVIIESPYAGATPEDVAINVAYARACLLNSLLKGEAPIASHLLYTQVLDDKIPEQRAMGIEAGLAWRKAKAPTIMPSASEGYDVFTMPVLPVFYTDLGWSKGMEAALRLYRDERIPFEERTIGPWATPDSCIAVAANLPPTGPIIEGGRGLEREGGVEP